MCEYFRSWKRKFGVILLALVLPAMVGWVRSNSSHDYIGVRFENSEYRFGSFLGYFCLAKFTQPNPTRLEGWKWEAFDWGTGPLKSLSGLEVDNKGRVYLNESTFWDENDGDRCRVTSRWDYSGIHFSKCELQDGLQRCTYTFPYWMVVSPLTVFSAWLLLSKRNRPRALKNSEPAK